MTNPPIDELLEPISEEQPAGADLRYDALYDRLRELRREDDPSLPQGIWTTDTKQAEWKHLVDEAFEALKTRTKDLQIGVWLTEALFGSEGLPGFTHGVKIIHALCETFWDTLHPVIDDEDLEGRLSPLLWLDTRGSQRLTLLPIAKEIAVGGSGPITWQTYLQAQKLEALSSSKPDNYREAINSGELPFTTVASAIRATPDSFYAELSGDLDRLSKAIRELSDLLDGLCGSEAPSFPELQRGIGDLAGFVKRTLSSRGVSATPPAVAVEKPAKPEGKQTKAAKAAAAREATAGESGSGESTNLTNFSKSSIRSREHAYQVIEIAARYLIEREPHSPAPYLALRAVTWGNMSLQRLLTELLAGGASHDELFKLLGMESDSED